MIPRSKAHYKFLEKASIPIQLNKHKVLTGFYQTVFLKPMGVREQMNLDRLVSIFKPKCWVVVGTVHFDLGHQGFPMAYDSPAATAKIKNRSKLLNLYSMFCEDVTYHLGEDLPHFKKS